MSILEKKVYGLSVLSWVIIAGLVVLFLVYIQKSDDQKEPFGVVTGGGCQRPVRKEDKKEDRKVTFSADTKDSVDNKIYNFNTSWCGYSVRFQPEWNNVMKRINNDKEISNAKAYDVKCDQEENEELCAKYGIEGFPTVVLEKGDRRIMYNGPRTADAIIEQFKNY